MKLPHRIVISDGFNDSLFRELQAMPEFDVAPQAKIAQEELQVLLPEVEGLVIRSATKPDREFLDKAHKLKYIIRAGEGTDNIDKAYCRKKGIKVSNTPGANNNSAAEHAIALMMTVLRKTPWAHSSMKGGKWEKSLFMGNELSHKTIGIIGFGRIGQLVAKRLSGFEPKVLFFDPLLKKSPFDYAKPTESLEEVFTRSDIVTIHVPLIEQTKHLVGEKLLSLMPSHSILINASRGGIVDEKALFHILKKKKIKGAGFDVFENEPLENSPLTSLDNFVMTPHLGGSTEEAQLRVGQMVIKQLREFFIKGNLVNEVKA